MPEREYQEPDSWAHRIPVEQRPPLHHDPTDSDPSQSSPTEILVPEQPNEEVFDDDLSFSFVLVWGFLLGLTCGYIFPDMMNWRGHHVMDPFTSRIEKESWNKDGYVCSSLVEDLDKSVLGFEETAKNLTKHAHDLVKRELHLPAVLTHYAALSLILRDSANDQDSDQQNELQQDILDCFFRAKQVLRPIHSQIHAGAKSRLPCTRSLWKIFIEKIVTVHVSYKKDEVFREVWSKVSEAITDAELQMWIDAKTHAEEAMNMMKEAFGREAHKYEAYGWSTHIAGIAFGKVGEHGKGRQMLFDAETALKEAKDRVSHLDFSKTMFRLFPHDPPMYASASNYMWFADGLDELPKDWRMHYA